jgi:hypothetical protein
MAHRTVLVVHITLLGFLLVKCIEGLLQTLHVYFAHSLKQHLELQNLLKSWKQKGIKYFTM